MGVGRGFSLLLCHLLTDGRSNMRFIRRINLRYTKSH
jgi:hypothetical protein